MRVFATVAAAALFIGAVNARQELHGNKPSLEIVNKSEINEEATDAFETRAVSMRSMDKRWCEECVDKYVCVFADTQECFWYSDEVTADDITMRDARKACNHKALEKCEAEGASCFLNNPKGRAKCEITKQDDMGVQYHCFCSACDEDAQMGFAHGLEQAPFVNPQ